MTSPPRWLTSRLRLRRHRFPSRQAPLRYRRVHPSIRSLWLQPIHGVGMPVLSHAAMTQVLEIRSMPIRVQLLRSRWWAHKRPIQSHMKLTATTRDQLPSFRPSLLAWLGAKTGGRGPHRLYFRMLHRTRRHPIRRTFRIRDQILPRSVPSQRLAAQAPSMLDRASRAVAKAMAAIARVPVTVATTNRDARLLDDEHADLSRRTLPGHRFD